YTSGSTGTPKGVLGTNSCLVNRIAWDQNVGGSNASLMKTSVSFVDSIWEVFSSLTTGQPIVIAKKLEDLFAGVAPADLPDGIKLRTAFVPSILHKLALTADLNQPVLGKVDYWIIGGEKLGREQAADIKAAFPSERLINTYGASEFWDAAFYDLDEENPYDHVPIGRPVDNVRIYILDRFMRPCPPNVAGELFIAGDGLARGYCNRVALTASRFLPNPFAADGTRMYRTGDIGKWRKNGTIEYVGRSDDQIKIRGFRIEIGEVEAAVRQHHAVGDAAVVARPGVNDEQVLVAYIVANGGEPVDADEIREFVSSRLLQFMVPAHFVILDALPKTHSGKLDRKSLPAPEVRANIRTKPRNIRETVVTEVFSEVLEVDDLSVTENFFDVGGHSLSALIVLAEIRNRTGASLALTAFYERPTVEHVANELRGLMSEHQGEI
ncbi:non-ribosomal peptide synthetase, partial [Tateyamaria omphalii]|uniref:non-ribosomal peptide synthetase n=1 Tax=Tateyamaria omphalii TaxID=299262 RepID=UPI001678F545